jgi:hypothetical protein
MAYSADNVNQVMLEEGGRGVFGFLQGPSAYRQQRLFKK